MQEIKNGIDRTHQKYIIATTMDCDTWNFK